MGLLRRRAGLAAVALLAPLAASAQDAPDPLAPPPPSEEALRRETGRLLARLARQRTTPVEEDVLLALSIEPWSREAGAAPPLRRDEAPRPLLEQERVVEVAVRRHDGGEDVRVRFREPAALRDRAHLALADGQAWAWDPTRRRAERARPLEPSWRVGGGGLLLADLRAEDVDAHAYVHVRDDRVVEEVGGERVERPVRVVRAVRREGGAVRLVALDAERHVPLVTTHLDAEGRVEREVRAADWRPVEGLLRPHLLVIAEPARERVTRVHVRGRRTSVPEARFDPARFAE